MRYAVLLLVVIGGLTVGGTMLNQYPIDVVFKVAGDGDYEMTLWHFIIRFLVYTIPAVLVLFLIWKIIRLPKTLKRFGKNRRTEKANTLLQKGLVAMSKGHWKKAEKSLAHGADISSRASNNPSIFLTLAAEAAQQQGVEVRRDQYLLEAHQLAAEGMNTLPTTLSEAELHLNAGEPQKALNLLQEQTGPDRNNNKFQHLICETYKQLGQHDEIWSLLPDMKKSAPSKAAYQEQQVEVAKAIFNSHDSSLPTVEKVWAELPKAAKKDDNLLLAFVSSLLYRGEDEQAEKLLAANIRHSFSDPLIHAYTQLETGSSNQRLNKITQWLKYQPTNAYLHYGAAKLAFQSDKLEEATKHIEASIAVLNLPEAFALLGKIAEAKGDNDTALAAYKKSVNLTYVEESKAVEGQLLNSESVALPNAVS